MVSKILPKKMLILSPTEQMNEDPNEKQSWVAEGNLAKMLATFAEYPSWVTNIFKYKLSINHPHASANLEQAFSRSRTVAATRFGRSPVKKLLIFTDYW